MANRNVIIKNIYYMLAYAFDINKMEQLESKDVSAEEFENIHNLFAAILGIGIGQQIKQGLYREYLDNTEDLATVRGKIEMSGTMRNAASRKRNVTCEYDELTENCLHNRILKSTVNLLLKSNDVSPEFTSNLVKEMRFFSTVDEIRDIKSIQWSSIRFHRNNRTYRSLLSLCQLILQGMLITEDSGEYRLASFIDKQAIYHLYERFILEYYRKEHHEIYADPSQIPWALDDGVDTSLPTMQSDIVLSSRDRSNVLIIDAKFYSSAMQQYYGKNKIHSHNLYQLFAYVKNKEAGFRKDQPHKVSGMLLYARTTEEEQPDNTFQMSGNRMDVHTLDLSRNFEDIKTQLDSYVTDAGFGLAPAAQDGRAGRQDAYTKG